MLAKIYQWFTEGFDTVDLKEAKVRIYFNNHARAKSVRNAFLLMDMPLIEHKRKEIKAQDQFTLGEF